MEKKIEKIGNIVISDQEIEILLAQWEAAKENIENKFVLKEEDGKKRNFTTENKDI